MDGTCNREDCGRGTSRDEKEIASDREWLKKMLTGLPQVNGSSFQFERSQRPQFYFAVEYFCSL
jgi:hypothetical protein